MEVDIGKGEAETACILSPHCIGEFSYLTKDRVLREATKRAMERQHVDREVELAGMVGFRRRPFCEFGAIYDEGLSDLACMNEQCMRRSCLACQQESHPGRLCLHIGKEQGEEEMVLPEGTVRCLQCDRLVCRESGCNLLVCPCEGGMESTTLCAVCGKDIEEERHAHFLPSGEGGCEMFEWDTI